jgi:hypothetical protein
MKKYYHRTEWKNFREQVIRLYDGRCSSCGRTEDDVVLQCHHRVYIEGRLPWQYSLDEVASLCKGCRAVECGILQPQSGWTLLGVRDLGDLIGSCQRPTGDGECGQRIRYEHKIYHPSYGEIIVGSTCVIGLTDESSILLKEIRKYWAARDEWVKCGRNFIKSDECWEPFGYEGHLKYSRQFVTARIFKNSWNWGVTVDKTKVGYYPTCDKAKEAAKKAMYMKLHPKPKKPPPLR